MFKLRNGCGDQGERNKKVVLKLRSGRDDHEAKKIHVLKVRSGCGDQGVRKNIYMHIYIETKISNVVKLASGCGNQGGEK